MSKQLTLFLAPPQTLCEHCGKASRTWLLRDEHGKELSACWGCLRKELSGPRKHQHLVA